MGQALNRFSLSNGLRVVHHHDNTTPMLAINLLYNVGARDERPGRTGMAHLFEHLMFAGSANVADYSAELQRAGGWDNAWTSNDFTNFYNVVPAVNAETAFRLESDRMLDLRLTQQALEVQRSVVIEEFKQTCLNQPYGDLGHLLRGLVYTTHPYRYPTIGRDIADIEAVTLDDLNEFFFHHYAPNNAVLAISGNITAERAAELSERWFGPIPRRDITPRTYQPEQPVAAPRQLTVYRRVPQALVVMAYQMDRYGTPAYTAADILTDLLANGRSARFPRNLMNAHPDIFTSAEASIVGSDEPGMLMLEAVLAADTDETVAQARALMEEQALLLARPGEVSQRELEKIANRYETRQIFDGMNYLSRAQRMAMAEMQGEDLNTAVERYRAVTPELVSKTAAEVFDPAKACTLIYRTEASRTDTAI